MTPHQNVAWALMLRRIGTFYHPEIRPDGCDEANATVAIQTLRVDAKWRVVSALQEAKSLDIPLGRDLLPAALLIVDAVLGTQSETEK